MPTLRLFNLDLLVQGADVARPDIPNLQFGDMGWHAKITDFEHPESQHLLTLKTKMIWRNAATVIVILKLRLTRVGTDFVVADGPHVQSRSAVFGVFQSATADMPGNISVACVSGAFRFLATMIQGAIHGDRGNLSVRFARGRIIEASRLPVFISRNMQSGGLQLDFASGTMTFLRGSFFGEFSAFSKHRVGGLPKKVSLRPVPCHSMRLSAPIETGFLDPVLEFEAITEVGTTPAPLALNADFLVRGRDVRPSAENPLIAPAGLARNRFRIALSNTVDGKNTIVRMSALRAQNANALFEMYGVRGRMNLPTGFNFVGEVALVARLERGKTAASLLVAPTSTEHGAANRSPIPLVSPALLTPETDDITHGLVEEIEFKFGLSNRLLCSPDHSEERQSDVVPDDEIAPELAFDFTLPHLETAGGSSMQYPRPGASFRDFRAKAGTVRNWIFSEESANQGGLRLPVLPPPMMASIRSDKVGKHIVEMNDAAKTFKADIGHVRHETFVEEEGVNNNPVRFHELYHVPQRQNRLLARLESSPAINRRAAPEDQVRLQTFKVRRKFGPFEVELEFNPATEPAFMVIRKGELGNGIVKFPTGDQENSRLTPNSSLFFFHAGPGGELPATPDQGRPQPKDPVLAIVKLSPAISWREIFARAGIPRSGENSIVSDLPNIDFIDHVLDAEVRADSWSGLLALDVPLDIKNFSVLNALAGNSVWLRYLAVTGEKSPQHGQRRFSLAGRVMWKNLNQNGDPLPSTDDETTFKLQKIDVAWRDNTITRFECDGDLTMKSVAGVQDKQKPTVIEILGRYDSTKEEFRFLGRLPKKLPILNKKNKFGPLKQIYFESAEIINRRGRVIIDIDGDIELQPITGKGFDKSWFDSLSGDRIDFKGFGLEFPEGISAGGSTPQWLKFNYPSLKLNPNLPHFGFFGLDWIQMQIRGIGLDWKGEFDWDSLVPLTNSGIKNEKTIFTDIRVDLGKLPELIAKSLKSLQLDFRIGYNFEDKPDGAYVDSKKLRVALRALGFEGLRLDLMRFLELRADKVEFGTFDHPGGKIPRIVFSGVRITVLGKPIIDGLTFAYFGAPGSKNSGFLAFYGPGEGGVVQTNLIDIHWILIGRNLRVPENMAKTLMSIDAPTQEADNKQVGEDLKKLVHATDGDSIYPLDEAGNVGEWLFGAGFSILGDFLSGKLLFQDRAYYGIALRGAALEEWFGYKLAISVLYIRRDRPEEDSFFVQIRVPTVTVGAFAFTGGVLAIEVFMNGSFMLDAGFPWLDGQGSRRWDRTFGAIVTPLQGSGGFYLSYRKTVAIQQQKKAVSFAGGYAVQAGLGATFNGGVFRVFVRAGLYGVLEGMAVLVDDKLTGLRLVGAIGVFVEGYGELNWWIISVRVGVLASAEARATLTWGIDPDHPSLPTADPGSVFLQLNVTLHARASARACIGSGPFKVCKGISASVTMPFRHRITLR